MNPRRHGFRSVMGSDIEQFLAHKRALGRRYDVEEKTLALFDDYLVANHIAYLAELGVDLIDRFLTSRPRPRPRSYNHLRCTPCTPVLMDGGARPTRTDSGTVAPTARNLPATAVHIRYGRRAPSTRPGSNASRQGRHSPARQDLPRPACHPLRSGAAGERSLPASR